MALATAHWLHCAAANFQDVGVRDSDPDAHASAQPAAAVVVELVVVVAAAVAGLLVAVPVAAVVVDGRVALWDVVDKRRLLGPSFAVGALGRTVANASTGRDTWAVGDGERAPVTVACWGAAHRPGSPGDSADSSPASPIGSVGHSLPVSE